MSICLFTFRIFLLFLVSFIFSRWCFPVRLIHLFIFFATRLFPYSPLIPFVLHPTSLFSALLFPVCIIFLFILFSVRTLSVRLLFLFVFVVFIFSHSSCFLLFVFSPFSSFLLFIYFLFEFSPCSYFPSSTFSFFYHMLFLYLFSSSSLLFITFILAFLHLNFSIFFPFPISPLLFILSVLPIYLFFFL